MPVSMPSTTTRQRSNTSSSVAATLDGVVFGLNESTAYVSVSDNQIYGLARRFIGDEIWARLKENVEITFRSTEFGTVDQVIEVKSDETSN